MRKRPALVLSSLMILAGAAGMAVIARLAPDVPPYLLVPAPDEFTPLLAIERAAAVALLIGLPSFGLSMGSVIGHARSLLPARVICCCAGFLCSCLLLLGLAWGTASSSEVLPIDTGASEALGSISVFLAFAAFVGIIVAGIALHWRSRKPDSNPA